ncbi:hypothetical protein CFC21_045745 [Triticum aestivum]|uniref:ENT domain-containing protein n=3 Tax=Triticinae TaxID=1648030 RepID=A0A3B6GM86_WHEAT|nr:uncharacterized protein LOC109769238 [Aegilops tauschii subsp. strangulata]XP_044352829.1 uncharacterized protein LOC123073895 [Triticum aestivum]KAF7034774.1 hypothetical protein CFC21_045745 [Triticum aestivum]
MRITLGMSLEAWVPTDAAAPPMAMGAWRAGEVVWGNGHSYVMRWFDGGSDSGRILRKFVRPLPDPAVKLPADLVPGDNVEVLDGSLWKWAEVVAAAADRFEVKIVGSSQVLTADRSALRPRQVYGEKGWVVLHKGNKIPVESVVPSRPIPGKNIKLKANNGNLGGGKFAAPHAVKLGGTTTTTKRSSHTVTVDGDVAPDAKRFHFHSSSKLFPKEAPDGNRLHSSIKLFPKDARYPSHCYLMKKRRQETSNDDKSYNEESCDAVGGTARDSSDTDDGSSSSSTSDRSSSSADGSDGDSSSSSSGSNSNGGVPEVPAAGERCQENREASIPPPPRSREEEEHDSSDGRASATMQHRPADEDEEEAVAMKRNRQAAEVHEDHGRVHGLELEAYVSVMKAFRATGPLSWAREELLSDLRLHLHVSGDEHLQLIRSLNGNN